MRTGKSLEGEIIVFEFGADYTLGTSALALFQVEERSLIELWNPCDHTIMPGLGEYEFDDSGGVEDVLARKYLAQKGIKQVFTLGDGTSPTYYPKRFLGHKLFWRFDKKNYGGYSPLTDEHFWTPFFKEAEIELKFLGRK